MKRVLWAAFAVVLGSASCAEEKANLGENPDPSTVGELGSLSMALTGFDAQGRQYWLRDAEFVVGPATYPGFDGGASPPLTISTDSDPLAESVSVSLLPGLYDVTLQGQYYLEYQTPNGIRRADGVTLLSTPTQQATITANQATQLVFRFAVDESGRGELTIGIDVEQRSDAGADGGVVAPDGGVAGGLDGGLDAGLDGGVVDAEVPDAEVADASVADAGATDTDAGDADGGTDDAGAPSDADVAEPGDADVDVIPPLGT
jgi:hypothetical protein